MRILRPSELPSRSVTGDGARGLHYRGPVDGDSLRINHVEIDPGGISRQHGHEWEQANYVLAGSGTLFCDGETRTIEKGDLVMIPGGRQHLYRNDGQQTLVLLGVLGPESLTRSTGAEGKDQA
ncbi:MAG: cupin domain-containing protein [Clostridia bacterium]